MDDTVVIIILNWNGSIVTNECLMSLLNIVYPNYRILVVDNGSTYDSIDNVTVGSPYIEKLKLETNLGFTGGNIAGLEYAQMKYDPDYVLLLNNDTTVEPNFLDLMISSMKSDKLCYAVVPKIFYYDDPNKIWFAGGKVSKLTGVVQHFGQNKSDIKTESKVRPTYFMNGCCALISRKAINDIGFLDNRFFANSEDADYSLRILASGHTILFEPNAVVFHKVNFSFKANKGKWLAFYLAARGIVLLQNKHKTTLGLFLFYPIFFIRWVLYLTVKLTILGDFRSIKGIYFGMIDGIFNRLRFVGKRH